jgi:hypothetical protein
MNLREFDDDISRELLDAGFQYGWVPASEPHYCQQCKREVERRVFVLPGGKSRVFDLCRACDLVVEITNEIPPARPTETQRWQIAARPFFDNDGRQGNYICYFDGVVVWRGGVDYEDAAGELLDWMQRRIEELGGG